MITVSPFISETTSTLVLPPVAKAEGEPAGPGAPAPRKIISSALASKPVITTFQSFASVIDPSEAKVTSYK